MGREIYWLWLELVFGVGGKRLWEFADKYGDPEELYNEIAAHKAEGMSDSETKRAERYKLSDAQEILDRAKELGQSFVGIDSADYPRRLRSLDDPPAVVFYRGDIGLLGEGTALHIVGTRTPSKYTESLVRVLCRELALRGFLLSSGFAEGVDTQAVKAALECGGKAVTVYPTSLEGEYPKGGGELKESLAEKGLLVSEYPPESKSRMNFQRRNRLAVALSSAVIIAEASAESRGLDNCRQAEKLGRPILVVPPHLLYSKRYFGQRDLLRSGCVPVFDGEDVVRVLAESKEISPDSHPLKGAVKAADSTERSGPVTASGRTLDEKEQRICGLMKENGAMLLDEISAQSGLSMAEVLVHITDLELDGIAESLPGKRYRLSR